MERALLAPEAKKEEARAFLEPALRRLREPGGASPMRQVSARLRAFGAPVKPYYGAPKARAPKARARPGPLLLRRHARLSNHTMV